MRIIGHLDGETNARTFSDYLYVKGIKNQVEAEPDGRWALWIHAEDELESARQLLQSYLANPSDATVQREASKASQLKEEERAVETIASKRYFDRDRVFPRQGLFEMGPLTGVLVALSVLAFVGTGFGMGSGITEYLLISTDLMERNLPEVRAGQVWRLLTPIFLHWGVLHIFFNMLCMRDLGTMIETRRGTYHLLLMVVLIGILSNLGQYFMKGPGFGGMSGVVYGLFGYAWMKSKFDPGSGLYLHSSTVTIMLIWFFFGFTNMMGTANIVHAVGLGLGIAWGYLEVQFS